MFIIKVSQLYIFPGWDRSKTTKWSVNRTRYCNWIGVKPVALNRALMCGEGGGLDVGWGGQQASAGSPGLRGPPSDGIKASYQPLHRSSPRKWWRIHGGAAARVESPSQDRGDNSDVSAPSWWVFCPVTHSNSCWVTSLALGGRGLCGIHWGFWAQHIQFCCLCLFACDHLSRRLVMTKCKWMNCLRQQACVQYWATNNLPDLLETC